MAKFLKRLFNRDMDSFLYNGDDYDEYEDRVPIYTMDDEPEIDFVDVNTGKPVDFIPVKPNDTTSTKYRLQEKKFTREQRNILSALLAEIDYEFVMNGYITQEKIHDIFGLDVRPVEEKEEEPAYVTDIER